ncbi:ETX/MTX2 family pore-forming toxin [Bacillus thuringiensis]|nr:ETX/MTX2 family pore-forming toxin [Bacillus thuringiensis]
MKYDSKVVEYIGENEFKNTSDVTQKFSTAKYTKTVTESVATATTKGFKVGGSGDGSNIFTIPLLLNNGIKINAEFNASTTETKTKSEAIALEAPAQSIEVPAHKTFKADVVLEQRNFWGDINFTGVGSNPVTTIKGTASYWAPNGMGAWEQYTFNDNTKKYFDKLPLSEQMLINFFGIEFVNNDVHVKGVANIKGIFGSMLTVNVYDITDKSNPTLVETRSFK